MITNVFKDLDRDGDGELRLEEAMNAFKTFDKDNFELFSKDAQKIFNMINFGSVDSEKNADYISYGQFCMCAMNETVLINEEKVDRAFDLFDAVSNNP